MVTKKGATSHGPLEVLHPTNGGVNPRDVLQPTKGGVNPGRCYKPPREMLQSTKACVITHLWMYYSPPRDVFTVYQGRCYNPQWGVTTPRKVLWPTKEGITVQQGRCYSPTGTY